tara:strand:+ start:280 stop:849 length:570 start_codon:yes stop_codon:yes gene_type:complete
MPLTKQHKYLTRQKILKVSGRLFRENGFDGISIDRIMENCGLTRGGFYAHFSSKSELFSEVIRSDHDLLDRLEARQGISKQELLREARDILGQYLSPVNYDKIANSCTIAALVGDAVHAGKESKIAFSEALKRFHNELQRSEVTEQKIWPIIVLTTGAMTLARSLMSKKEVNTLLLNCQKELDLLMPEP